MGTFNILAPILAISSTPSSDSSPLSLVPFRTMYLDDPWTPASLSTLDEHPRPTRMKVSLSIVETTYQATLDPAVDLVSSSSWTEEVDLLALPAWVVAYSCLHYCLDDILLSNEAIIDAMNCP